VRLSYETDKPLDELDADLGISRSSLNRWRREYGEDPDQAFPRKGQQKERDAEVAQLKKALREAQLENEVLKHIIGYRSNRLAQTPGPKMGAVCIPCF
jgi:transposase